MVLHFREQDDIALANESSTPGLSHEIDALGRATGENDFVRGGRAEIFSDERAGALVGFWVARVHERVKIAAMDIGVIAFCNNGCSVPLMPPRRGFCELAALSK